MDESRIKGNIEKARADLGISQTEMAERLGIDRNSYRNLEKGRTRIINSNMDRLSELLGVSVEKLVLGYEPQNPEEGSLHDYQERYQVERDSLVDGYEKKLEILRLELEKEKEVSKALRKTIETSEELIAYLRKRLQQLED